LFSNVSFVFKRQFCFQTSVPKWIYYIQGHWRAGIGT
jgi:hypothetical protein